MRLGKPKSRKIAAEIINLNESRAAEPDIKVCDDQTNLNSDISCAVEQQQQNPHRNDRLQAYIPTSFTGIPRSHLLGNLVPGGRLGVNDLDNGEHELKLHHHIPFLRHDVLLRR